MFTKKTRALSAVAAVFMLLSLVAGFVLPVSADPAATYYDEVVSATGLKDVSALPDITAYSDGVTEYKVSSRAGMDKLVELAQGGKTFAGVSIYQAADIDMLWEPYYGIGYGTTGSFQGTFDGNGFVFENLYVYNPMVNNVGLFGKAVKATLKNIGIASGLVIGGNYVGSIVGEGQDVTILNCWSAATVIGGGADGVSGIAGRAVNVSKIYNSYSLGLIYNWDFYATGLASWVNNDDFRSANNYTMCEIVTNFAGRTPDSSYQMPGYNALFRLDSTAGRAQAGTNNYYRNGNGTLGGYTAGKLAYPTVLEKDTLADDGSTGMDAAAFADGTLVAALNTGDLSAGAVEGYEIAFAQSSAGYPVLTYSKEGEVVVKRTAHTEENIGKNTWAEKSALFALISENRAGKFAEDEKIAFDTLDIASAEDLFILGLFTSWVNPKDYFGVNEVRLTADIDMSTLTIQPVDYFVPLTLRTSMNFVLDGQNHVISNWKTRALIVGENPQGALIPCMRAGTVKNLGMLGGVSEYAYSYGSGYSYPSLMIERIESTASLVENCFAVGDIYVGSGATNNNNNSGVVSRVMHDVEGLLTARNVWADVNVHYTEVTTTTKARAIGSAYATDTKIYNLSNVYYISPSELVADSNNSIASTSVQPMIEKDRANGELAYFLNSNSAGTWRVSNGETVFADQSNATYRVALNRNASNGSLIESAFAYVNAGESYTIPSYENYTLDESSLPAGTSEGTFVMPAEDVTISYTLQGVDLGIVQGIIDKYAVYDVDLFTQAEEIKTVVQSAQDILTSLEGADLSDPNVQAQATVLINYLTEQNGAITLELKNEYPYYPNFSDFAIYKDLNTAKNWGVSSKEDWLALVADATVTNINIHFLQDVDMENTQMKPLLYGGKFNGVLDGHDHVIQNISIKETISGTTPVGLVSYLGSSGVIKNLGVESGLIDVTYTNSNDGYGIGALAGNADGPAQIIRCWNGAAVTGKASGSGAKGLSISGIVGRGYNNTIIDSCYNIGTITGDNHAAGVNDWGQSGPGGQIYNTFNAGKLIASGGETQFARYNSNITSSITDTVRPFSNSYAIGTPFYNITTTPDYNVLNVLADDAYTTGEVGYVLNQNYEGKGERTYYTIKDGKVTFGDASNQVRRITLNIAGSDTPSYVYAAAGSSYTLSYADNAIYALADGSDGSLEGNILLVPNNDNVVVNVSFSGFNTAFLESALAAFDGKDLKYFVNGEETEALIAGVQEKLANESYESQEAVDADTQALKDAYVYAEAPSLPSITEIETYRDAPGYMINSLADFEAVAADPGVYSVDKTLYLNTDIDLTDSSFTTFASMQASFDGMNHTIRNLANCAGGVFTQFKGKAVRNLTLENITSNCKWNQGILIDMYQGSAPLTIENITLRNCIGNKVEANGMGGLLGYSAVAQSGTIRNCLIEGVTLNGAVKGNIGLIVSQVNQAGWLIENVTVRNSIVQSTAGWGIGAAFGEITGANSVVRNIAVFNNTVPEGQSALMGVFKKGSLELSNIMAAGNTGAARVLTVTTSGNEACTGFTATDIFTDEEAVVPDNDSVGTILETTAFTSGEAAYLANSRDVAQKWAMLSGESYPSFAAAETALPVRVTFTATDTTDPENSTTTYYYTDNTGVLIGIDDTFIASATWDYEGDLKTAVFSENATITGSFTTCDHQWSDWTHVEGTETHKRVCALCTKEEVANCTYGEEGWAHDDASDPSSHSKTCTACGNVAAEACSFTENVVAPTHTEGGYTEHTCETCGYSYQDNEQDALGHTWGEWTHVEGTENADAQHKHVCTEDDGGEETLSCSFNAVVVDPTCTEGGYTEHTCADCGYSYQDTPTDPNGHDWGEWYTVTEPSYTADGLERHDCKNCDDYETNPIPKLTDAALVVNAETARAGEDVVVEISLANNTGLAGATLNVTYDATALKLKSAENGDLFATFVGVDDTTINDNPFKVSVANVENVTEDGVVVRLTFTVLDETAAGNYDISVTMSDSSDAEGAEVTFKDGTGKVEVIDFIWGDADGSGVAEMADATLILRYLAGLIDESKLDMAASDTDGSGKVEMADVTLILRNLAGLYDPANPNA